MLEKKLETQNSKPETEAKNNDISLDKLIKAHKINIARKIQAGETGLAKELEYLQSLEARQNEAEGRKQKTPNPNHEHEIGIPEHLRVKRNYTMTVAAREQRSKAGKARADKGIKPNWKHGKYARSFIEGAIRPCKSSCHQYPCALIADGSVKPGSMCLDKAAVIQTYTAIINAVKNKKMDDYNDIASLTIAQSIQTLNMLLEDIIRDGTTIKRERTDAQGNVIGVDYVHHPALNALPKMIADLGMTPQEMMITPRALTKQITEDDGVKTIADIMSRVGEVMRKKTETQKQ